VFEIEEISQMIVSLVIVSFMITIYADISPYTEGLNWVQVDAEDCSPPQDGAAGLSETSELIQPSVITHNTII